MSARAKPSRRIALSGYYGFRNAGDEAVLAGLIKSLRAAHGGDPESLDIESLSIDQAGTRRDHAIDAAHRYQIPALIAALSRCDLLASGGGSLLQDVTSRHSIFYYLGVVRAAQIMGKKTMFVAQGIGPLSSARSRNLTASVARRCDAITVRDSASADLLRDVGVDRPEIAVTADPALLLATETPIKGSGVGFSLRCHKGLEQPLISSLYVAVKQSIPGVPQRTIAMSPDDVAIHKDFETGVSLFTGGVAGLSESEASALSWQEARDATASCEMVVGMRLHALILAAANGVPSLALSYDPKVDAFMRQTGQGDAIFDIREEDPRKLSDLMAKIWAGRDFRSKRLHELLPDLRTAALKNGEIALKLLI